MQLDKHHIILYVAAIGLALFGVYLIEANRADRAQSRADAAQAQAQLIQKQNEQFQAQTAAQLAALEKALEARQQVEVKLPTQYGSYTAAQVATTIQEKTSGKVVATADSIVADLPAGRDIAVALQLVPLLQQDKADLQKSLDLEKQAHVSDITSCRATVIAAKEETKAAKADARKGKLKWFGIGVVVGFIGRGFAGF